MCVSVSGCGHACMHGCVLLPCLSGGKVCLVREEVDECGGVELGWRELVDEEEVEIGVEALNVIKGTFDTSFLLLLCYYTR